MSRIELRGVSVRFGPITALQDIDLTIPLGATTAIIGANGAGKSTLLRALIGLDPLSAGRIHLDEQDISDWPLERRRHLGLALSPEGRRLFPEMSVRDNLLVGAYLRRDRTGIQRDLKRMLERFPSLAARAGNAAGSLSGGEQQMCAIGRALMAAPRVILLDEPSLGLAPGIVAELAEVITEIAQDGVTVVLVEQNSRLALTLARTGHVLEAGRLVLSAPAQDLLADPRVICAYLGEAPSALTH